MSKQTMQVVLEALRNVPMVGDAFDQQHSDQHMQAELALMDCVTHHDELVAALREYMEADSALRAVPTEPTHAWRIAEGRYRAAKADALNLLDRIDSAILAKVKGE